MHSHNNFILQERIINLTKQDRCWLQDNSHLVWVFGDDQREVKKSDITETGLISQEFFSYNAMLARLPQREKHPTICSFRGNSHQFRVYRRRRYICLKWDFSIASNLPFKCYGWRERDPNVLDWWYYYWGLLMALLYFQFFNGSLFRESGMLCAVRLDKGLYLTTTFILNSYSTLRLFLLSD